MVDIKAHTKEHPMPSLEAPYRQLCQDLARSIPASRLITDPLRTLAFGTDASFYRLIPKLVVKAEAEAEIVTVLQAANRHNLPVTFRAAGTSLSGQAVSDAILLIAAGGWQRHQILDGGQRIRLQPGIIGAHANRHLAPYGRKIGPDPASINAAMIGGILANNASGMCCGVAQNSYQTVESLRLILADGTLLDTADANSRQAFAQTHGDLLARLARLAEGVRKQPALADRIRHKFKIKNTTGYSLNALVDYTDPFDILVHLMVGSEGTLGFVSEVVYRTVVEHPFKASALMIFPGIEGACHTAAVLKTTPVSAVELMDRAALRSVENKAGMPAILKTLPPAAAALLVETRAEDGEALAGNVAAIAAALEGACQPASAAGEWRVDCPAAAMPFSFTADALENARLWNIRKGLFPSVGAMRRGGTTVIIEDVAFPIHHLAAATVELQQLLQQHRYDEAIIFGHALEGNLHFVFTQDFSQSAEVDRYRQLMDAVCTMVVTRYDGSLKAEHGTGRNMAPFVALEWGQEAYALMGEIKAIFDPKGLLNPGVILNADAQAHLKNLKPLPQAHPLVDKCIECGFCEEVCPSKALTLTPRQRIVVQREIARLARGGEDPARLARLRQDYAYQGEQTCAADGLCSLSCPVEINTGEHTKYLRGLNTRGRGAQRAADLAARHFGLLTDGVRLGLWLLGAAQRLLGSETMPRAARLARRLSGNRLPCWTPYLPGPAPRRIPSVAGSSGSPKVVYFPSCVSRTMGPALGDRRREPLVEVTARLLARAGFSVVYPAGMAGLCCGTPFESKGFQRQADEKAAELNRALLAASEGGRYPVLCDTSPCTERMHRTLDARLKIYEPVAFIRHHLLPRLPVTPVDASVALHVTCSARKMGLADTFVAVARQCAAGVVVPDRVDCCAFAGDRGFSFPELNRSALTHLRPAVAGRCCDGYSNSRTCEIGLSEHSGIHYRSILYLLDECTR
jgi:D-lactate dehydrogenase